MMTVPAETTLISPGSGTAELTALTSGSDRRADVDAKMQLVAAVLKETGADGLLLLAPENTAWITSGGMSRGILDPQEIPGVYCSSDARWLLCSNADSQRWFDEEIDGLGFQLKEWPYHWGRAQLLADLCQNRKVACDRPLGECLDASAPIQMHRRRLSTYEQACAATLGNLVAHGVEATCRTMDAGLSERDIAAQVAHRLIHRGVQPVQIGVAVDGRSRRYRRHGYSSAVMNKYAVVSATGRKYGLHVSATRSVSIGEIDPEFRKEHNAVCKVQATYLASTWPDAVPREILTAGKRIHLLSGYEHEWTLAPQGFLTGRAAVEMPLVPSTDELFQSGWVVTWTACAGAACAGDTYLIADGGPKLLTPTESWPLKRIRVQGAEFVHPDILQR